ncbi:MAG TPA: hypothetical protein PKE33_04865 [Kiritimatiellia bacterium]|nr:hypothetical protein [Kiritimatiellia bacterium]
MAVDDPSVYKPAAIISMLYWGGWITMGLGGLWLLASIGQGNLMDFIYSIAVIGSGGINYYISIFLSRVDKAAHKILNS